MSKGADAGRAGAVLVSRTGVPLGRATTFRFTLDVNQAQHRQLLAHAGAARLAFNHHLGRVRANLDQRTAEHSYGIPETELTPSLSWSKVSFINEMNAWKDGRAPDAPVTVDADGNEVRGLAWRGEVSADVFESGSVNAAQALANWSASCAGARAGRAAGFPRFKSRHRTAPAFRLRAKYTEGAACPVRPAGPKSMRVPKLGELRVRETTRGLRRLLETGRFHVYAAAFRFERGRWVVAVTGVAAALHHQRRGTGTASGRHQPRVGVDLGVKTLAVVADAHGRVLHAWQGVKALQHAQARLKLANQSYSRTKRDSAGRREAARRLGRVHARVAHLRRDLLHRITTELARGDTSVTIEDLNAAGMLANRRLARVVSDAAFGELRRQLAYKTTWDGTELVVADRWYPSSKTCSGCGQVKADLTLADRAYACDGRPGCGLVIDRDVNAAVNLARYTPSRAPSRRRHRRCPRPPDTRTVCTRMGRGRADRHPAPPGRWVGTEARPAAKARRTLGRQPGTAAPSGAVVKGSRCSRIGHTQLGAAGREVRRTSPALVRAADRCGAGGRLAAVGAVSWREATAEALFGERGFYRCGAGPAGHFRTSVHASPGFAAGVLALAREARLDTVVDVGSGRGELLLQLRELDAGLRLVGVEVAERPDGLPPDVEWEAAVPVGLRALLVANEWLDDVPVDVVERTPEGVRLVLVDPRTGAETAGAAPTERDRSWLDRWWPLGDDVGARAEIGRPRDEAWAATVSSLGQGLAVAIDYAHRRESRPRSGTLSGYRAGRQVLPVPDGSCDITSHVALDACAAAGEAAGAGATLLTTQRAALQALGLVADAPTYELARSAPATYLAALARAGDVAELTARGGLGDFGWLVQGIGMAMPQTLTGTAW